MDRCEETFYLILRKSSGVHMLRAKVSKSAANKHSTVCVSKILICLGLAALDWLISKSESKSPFNLQNLSESWNLLLAANLMWLWAFSGTQRGFAFLACYCDRHSSCYASSSNSIKKADTICFFLLLFFFCWRCLWSLCSRFKNAAKFSLIFLTSHLLLS